MKVKFVWYYFKAISKPAVFVLPSHKVSFCYVCMLNSATSFLLAGPASGNTQSDPDSHLPLPSTNSAAFVPAGATVGKILKH